MAGRGAMAAPAPRQRAKAHLQYRFMGIGCDGLERKVATGLRIAREGLDLSGWLHADEVDRDPLRDD